MKQYLTDIPSIVIDYGFSKVLAVRREVIHIKHIFTELFVRKTINIESMLNILKMSVFDYMEIMTNRLRRIHYFSREYDIDCNDVVKTDRDRFFPTLELLTGLDKIIVLDFDKTVTSNNFKKLYELCIQRERVEICTANPMVTEEWFRTHNLSVPSKIHSMRGKIKKIKRLIELMKTHDYVFYVDDQIEYLNYAWIFGIQTYHWDNHEIKYYSLNSK